MSFVKLKVRMSVIKAMQENRAGSKYAPPMVNSVIPPMRFSRTNIIAGAVLYDFSSQLITVPDTRIEWI